MTPEQTRKRLYGLALFAALMIAAPARADDAALLVGVERYTDLGRVREATRISEVEGALAARGFQVDMALNPTVDEMRRKASDFAAASTDADVLVVALAGQFATDGRRTWLLARDALAPRLFGIEYASVSVDSILQVLATRPGHALLLLGFEDDGATAAGTALATGIALPDIPQGVTVITGAPGAIADLLSDTFAGSTADVIAIAHSNRRLRLQGFVPPTLLIGSTEQAEPSRDPVVAAQPSEDAMWNGTVALDTVQAYQEYLNAYPAGLYAADARRALEQIRTEPNRLDRQTEDALGLSRGARRDIQRNLTLLGYDTRGIDGIFGPGTRRAIANWQQQNGYAQTTYLSADQINRLDAQASRRAQELEAEASRQQALLERQDRAYWEETGAVGDEPGLRAYLDRYADGLFADEARAAIAAIDAQKRESAAAEDATAWDSAREADTPAAYRRYLTDYPQGEFRGAANARIAELEQRDSNADADAAASAAESELRLDPVTARLVEGRLQGLGLEPGRVDGRFDNNTRRAIRRYQGARGLEQSGYLNRQTVARLLADTLGDLGR